MLRRLVDRADELQGARRLLILHFNDVYDVSNDAAAKFASKLQEFEGYHPLILFSGDCYSPSLMSVITKGAQMPKVLNHLGVQAAVFGNHEFDWGVPRAEELCAQCAFPWLMSNAWLKATGEPLGGGERTVLLDHNGIKVGLMGLIEKEWLGTLSTIDESEIEWRDDVEVARELSAELRQRGAEVVIALTHMRLPNDERLMRACCGGATAGANGGATARAGDTTARGGGGGCLDLILGGHDHDASVSMPAGSSQPRLVKSGTDFRELSEVVVEVESGDARAVTVRGGTTPRSSSMSSSSSSSSSTSAASAAAAPPRGVRITSVRRVEVGDGTPADAAMVEVVRGFESLVDRKMDSVIGSTAVPLDARFRTIRSSESNVSNFVADVLREGANADLALLNAGTLRADRIFEAGPFAMRDLVRLLPMADETVVLRISGADLVSALENGVSQYPRLDGRWPCVSALRFAFDPSRPPGHRLVPNSVHVAEAAAKAAAARAGSEEAGNPVDISGAEGGGGGDVVCGEGGEGGEGGASSRPPVGYVPVSPTAVYTLATKAYLAQGKDGYASLKRCEVAVDAEQAPLVPGLVRNHFVERAAAAGHRTTGVLSPVKLAKARTVQKPPRPSRLAESARRQGACATPAAPTPATAAPTPAKPAPTPLGENARPNVAPEQLVTPQHAVKGPAHGGVLATPLDTPLDTPVSPMVSPGAQASPGEAICSSRLSAADPLRGGICPEVEGRIECLQPAGSTA